MVENERYDIDVWTNESRTVGSQADISENILFQNLTVCIETYICDLSFPKIAVLKVL